MWSPPIKTTSSVGTNTHTTTMNVAPSRVCSERIKDVASWIQHNRNVMTNAGHHTVNAGSGILVHFEWPALPLLEGLDCSMYNPLAARELGAYLALTLTADNLRGRQFACSCPRGVKCYADEFVYAWHNLPPSRGSRACRKRKRVLETSTVTTRVFVPVEYHVHRRRQGEVYRIRAVSQAAPQP